MVKQNGECCAHAQCSGGVFLTSAMTSYSLGGGTDIHIQSPGGSIFAVPTAPGSSGSLTGTGIMPPTIGEYWLVYRPIDRGSVSYEELFSWNDNENC